MTHSLRLGFVLRFESGVGHRVRRWRRRGAPEWDLLECAGEHECDQGDRRAHDEHGLQCVDERVQDLSYRKFYMHGTSHWLGLDVHDVGAYTRDGKARPLEPGMVITVEPGLYIARDAPDAPAELRGIGVRIEDDVVVTADGHEVLTAACPKKIEDVEAACRS